MRKSISLLAVLSLILGIFYVVVNFESDGAIPAEEALNVSVVVSSTFGDMSFNDSAQAAGEQLKADYGVNVNYIECKKDGYKQKMMEAAEMSDFVVAVGWECYEIEEVAPEYPNTKFIFVDNSATNIKDIPNLQCVTYAQNEGGFLAGYIAAEMSSTGTIGAVTGDEGTMVSDYLAGYKQGAKYANPDVKVEVINAGEYEDPIHGRECALQLWEKGADVIFNIAGNTGIGIFSAAEEMGFYAIGVDGDQKVSSRQYDDYIICSVTKDVGKSFYDVIAAYLDDAVWNGGQNVTTNMENGYVAIAYGDSRSPQQISDELKAEVQELTRQIMSGDLKVKSAK